MVTIIIAAGGLIISIISLSFSFYQYRKENTAEMIGHLSEPKKYGDNLNLVIRNVGRGIAVNVEVEFSPPLPVKVKLPIDDGVLDLNELFYNSEKYSKLYDNGSIKVGTDFLTGLESLKSTDEALGEKPIKIWFPGEVRRLPYYMFTDKKTHRDPNGKSKNGVPNNSKVIIKWKNYGSLLPIKHKNVFPLDVSSALLTGILDEDVEKET